MTDRASPVERAEAARRAQEEEEERAAYRASVAAGYKPSRHTVPRRDDHPGAVTGENEIAWRRSIRRCLVWICAGIWFAIISANIGALIWVVWAATRQGG